MPLINPNKTFEQNLEDIAHADYGKEVRPAMHDGLLQMAGITGSAAADALVAAASANTAASAAEDMAGAAFSATKTAMGGPVEVDMAAEMADTNQIYVYRGEETGYTAGHWYYYNASVSAWADGGTYREIATDPTLELSGVAADAGAAGAKINGKLPMKFSQYASIPENADLNDYTTPGVYYIDSSEDAAAISNIPTASAGILLVVDMYAGTRKKQFFLTASYVFFRSITATVSEWLRIATTSETDALQNEVFRYNKYEALTMGEYASGSAGGVDFTYNGNGEWTIAGTATSSVFYNIISSANSLPKRFIKGMDYRVEITGDCPIRIYKYFTDNTSTYTTYSADSAAKTLHIDDNVKGIIIRFQPVVDIAYDTTGTYKIINLPAGYHRIAWFGDSVAYGTNGNGGRVAKASRLPEHTAALLDAVVDNYGVGSQGYIGLIEAKAYDNISSKDLTKDDVIVINYGVNDGFKPLGDWNSLDESTIMGQFNKIVSYLGTNYPGKRVIVVAPINGRNAGTFPKYWYGVQSSTATSRQVLSDALKQACRYYNIPYIEQTDGPISGYSIQTLIGGDGVHPSPEGYDALSCWLAGELHRLIF